MAETGDMAEDLGERQESAVTVMSGYVFLAVTVIIQTLHGWWRKSITVLRTRTALQLFLVVIGIVASMIAHATDPKSAMGWVCVSVVAIVQVANVFTTSGRQ